PRISVHEFESAAVSVSGRKRTLASKCIPDSDAKVVISGATRTAREEIQAAQGADRENDVMKSQLHAGAGLEKVRPILDAGIDGEVPVPEKLGGGKAESRACLRIEQHVVCEAADIDPVEVR